MAAHLTLRHRGFDRVARFEETFQFHHVEAEKKNIVDNFCLILFQSRGVCLYMYIYNIHVQMQMNTHGSNHIYISMHVHDLYILSSSKRFSLKRKVSKTIARKALLLTQPKFRPRNNSQIRLGKLL